MKKLFYAVIIMVIFIGCSKDKDEETSTPTATAQELILGEWDCTSWTQEGAEIMQWVEYYKMDFFMEATTQTFEFEYMTDTDGTKWRGTYEFEDNDTKLKTVFTNQWFWGGSDWVEVTPDPEKSWDIVDLTSETLKMTYVMSAQGLDYNFAMTLEK